MRLEHVGVAVSDAQATISLLYTLLGARPYKTEVVESESVRTVFFEAGGTKLELLEASSPDSPVARHIGRRGEGLHHLAFQVEDITAAHERLSEAGFRLLNDAPKRGADEKLIFFVHPKDTHGVLVELCQTVAVDREPRFAAVRGRQVAYYEAGRQDAPPLVLLHGALGSVELELYPLIRQLEPHFRTVAIDFSGHGRSDDLPGEEPDIEIFAEDVLGVIDHADLARTNLFGYSLGGLVALHLALQNAGRLERIALHATNVQWDAEEAQAMADALNSDRLLLEAPHRAEALARTHGPDRWQPRVRAMARFTRGLPQRRLLDDDLATIEHRVLVSLGDRDRFVDLEHALHLWRTLSHGYLAVHAGLDHRIENIDVGYFGHILRNFFLAGPQG